MDEIIKLVFRFCQGHPVNGYSWAINGPGNSPNAVDNPTRIGAFVASGSASNDTAGHIIGRQFYGEARHDDDGRRNVFAQNAMANNVTYSTFENSIAATIPTVCSICVMISFRYESTRFPDRPSRFTYRWLVESPPGMWVNGYVVPPGVYTSPQEFSNNIPTGAQTPIVPWR